MHTTHDIPTPASTLVITDTKHLSDVIFEMAKDQLVLDAASANLQASIEAAKKSFDEATTQQRERIAANLAAVEAFASKNRDTLFPVKGKRRSKTFNVLQHALKYRSSDSVEAPANAVQIIKQLIAASEVNILNLGRDCDEAREIAAMIARLEALIRTPQPELNKDAVKAVQDDDCLTLLADNGIKVETTETFKVEFNFTPSAS